MNIAKISGEFTENFFSTFILKEYRHNEIRTALISHTPAALPHVLIIFYALNNMDIISIIILLSPQVLFIASIFSLVKNDNRLFIKITIIRIVANCVINSAIMKLYNGNYLMTISYALMIEPITTALITNYIFKKAHSWPCVKTSRSPLFYTICPILSSSVYIILLLDSILYSENTITENYFNYIYTICFLIILISSSTCIDSIFHISSILLPSLLIISIAICLTITCIGASAAITAFAATAHASVAVSRVHRSHTKPAGE